MSTWDDRYYDEEGEGYGRDDEEDDGFGPDDDEDQTRGLNEDLHRE